MVEHVKQGSRRARVLGDSIDERIGLRVNSLQAALGRQTSQGHTGRRIIDPMMGARFEIREVNKLLTGAVTDFQNAEVDIRG